MNSSGMSFRTNVHGYQEEDGDQQRDHADDEEGTVDRLVEPNHEHTSERARIIGNREFAEL